MTDDHDAIVISPTGHFSWWLVGRVVRDDYIDVPEPLGLIIGRRNARGLSTDTHANINIKASPDRGDCFRITWDSEADADALIEILREIGITAHAIFDIDAWLLGPNPDRSRLGGVIGA